MNSRRKPSWLNYTITSGKKAKEVRSVISNLNLHTVCHEARCPNRGECYSNGTATFLIMGPVCTRNCRYCSVAQGQPEPLTKDEPFQVAQAVKRLGLKHGVITSVTRDDLSDGGAGFFSDTIRAIRHESPETTVEVLVPDFRKSRKVSLKKIVDVKPDVFNHNIEIAEKQYQSLRPMGSYRDSLLLLEEAAKSSLMTKSGLMIGLGEGEDDILQTMKDLRSAGVTFLTVGQYLQPGKDKHPVEKYYTPEEFEMLTEKAYTVGFEIVQCSPLTRSSYNAHTFSHRKDEGNHD